MKKYLIDTNIFDKLLSLKNDNIEHYQALQSKEGFLYSTWWQVKEIESIKDESRKNELLSLIEELKIEITGDVSILPHYIPTIIIGQESFALYKSILEKYGTSNPDARAAVIATLYDATLVTEDGNGKNKGLIQSCKETISNFKVINFQDFIKETFK